MSVQASPQCEAMVRYDMDGRRVARERRCRTVVRGAGRYCGVHARVARRRAIVTISPGGWCVWCGRPGDRYESDSGTRVPLALCMRCGPALAEAIRARSARREA